VGETIATLAAYRMAVQACLLAAQRRRVAAGGPSGWRRVFLVGALRGWLVEGVLVSTIMDAPPLSWSSTTRVAPHGAVTRAEAGAA
jgi:hypothetical protein